MGRYTDKIKTYGAIISVGLLAIGCSSSQKSPDAFIQPLLASQKAIALQHAIITSQTSGNSSADTTSTALTPTASASSVSTSPSNPTSSNYASSNPIDNVVPTQRLLQPIQPTATTAEKFGDVTFSVPWQNPQTSTVTAQSGKWIFATGGVGIIPKESAPNEYLNDFLGSNAQTAAEVKAALGPNNFESTYTFYKMVLNTTPETLTMAPAALQAVYSGLLTLKESLVTEGTGDTIYAVSNFSTPDVVGFQFGTETSNPKNLLIFDKNRYSYELLIQGTQAETDYILSTVKAIH